MPSPSLPEQLEPSPWRPRCALYSGLKRKWTSVLWRSLDSIIMSPPRPPSPPEGPPRGTNFSRRKAMHPLPPSPALILMIASSINMLSIDCTGHGGDSPQGGKRRAEAGVVRILLFLFHRSHAALHLFRRDIFDVNGDGPLMSEWIFNGAGAI